MTVYDDTLDYDGDWTYFGVVAGEEEVQVVVEIDVSTTTFALVEDEEFTGEQYESSYQYEDGDGPLGVGVPIDYAGAQVTWTDITSLVRSVSLSRGRPSTTFGGFEAGSATIELLDSNADFIPGNTGSAYYPNIRPMRPIRITAVFSGEYNRLFRGYVDSWDVQWDPASNVSAVSIQATDAFKILSNRQTTVAGVSGDTPGERADEILDSILWPSTFREIDASGWSSPLGAGTGDSQDSLAALQAVEFAESGALFVTGAGKIRFKTQGNTYREGYDWTFTDTVLDGAINYETVTLNINDDKLANVLTLTDVASNEVTLEDGASKDIYERQEFSATGVLTRDVAATTNLAEILLARDAQPLERISEVTVNGRRSLANMNLIVSYELMDKAALTLSVPGGYTATTTVYLTAVSHEISPKTWAMTFVTSDDFYPPQEWQDVEATIAWEDVSATLTWLQVAEGTKVE